jgi:hypothetical protein
VSSPLFEIALVLVRLDHDASVIINVNHSIQLNGCDAARNAVLKECVATVTLLANVTRRFLRCVLHWKLFD